MKQYIIYFLFYFLALPNFAQIVETNDVIRLRDAYNKLLSDKSPKAQAEFFMAFPENWSDFIIMDHELTYRYNAPFYLYIEEFGSLTAINDTLYCSKLINLTLGADLDADAPNALHALLHKVMEDPSFVTQNEKANNKRNMPAIMLWILSHQLKGDIMRFWQFYWSSLYFEEDSGVYNDDNYNEDFYRLQEIVKKKYPHMLPSMTMAYQFFHHGILYISSYGNTQNIEQLIKSVHE